MVPGHGIPWQEECNHQTDRDIDKKHLSLFADKYGIFRCVRLKFYQISV